MSLFLEQTSSEEWALDSEVLKYPELYLNTSCFITTLSPVWNNYSPELKAHWLKTKQKGGEVR